VKGLPTPILVENGEDVRRHAGTLSHTELTAFIEGDKESSIEGGGKSSTEGPEQ
jgi:hypothetical protein